jgi:prevent-host-death family protein
MPTVTASEYSKKVGLYQTIAQREPVIITSHGREETVLISADEYRRLTRRRRRPYLIENLPEEDWHAIEKAYASLKAQSDC